ncbi:alpha/beta-hydrolase [Aaosphaeria arxii CBS 175.79]|uniref:Carboxylic ester hydrolase n=1 Tax=Aaosphaeria arxii CBS 175.79 TaxID=1450172 RepID=A0A6A5XR26_9PLEO|nr:alpha/beta-hydrolase [Aaosphaeria arxii CBS 175.79]KAF2015287.1 alpha/beta-hydrolase [Aaosphaeria arxii CBS 175.79]
MGAILGRALLQDRKLLLALSASVVITIVLSTSLWFTNNDKASSQWLPKVPHSPSQTSSLFSPPSEDPENPYLVKLDYLSIQPNVSDTIRFYWNMPYAASAYGENRFRGPQPPPKMKGTLGWSGELGMCPRIQKIDPTLRNRNDIANETVPGIETKFTEDCLSLNVFTPIDAKVGDELPVLVNIPGGGFHLPGRSNCGEMVEKSRRDKDNDKGIICVTMYYRNGIYGFLSGDEIEEHGDLNMGLRDQRASLEWVQKYIRYFGGNPDNVVIMGTSAGGASVLMQLAANGGDHSWPTPGSGSKQLFHGIIAQSPAAPTFFTREQGNLFWDNVANGLNCTDKSIDCVRNASVGDLYYENYPMAFEGRKTPPRWMWAPTTEKEGGLWTEPSIHAILNGRYARVPSIIGFTTNEGSDQTKKDTDTEADMRTYIQDHYPLLTDSDLDAIVATYTNDKHWPDSGRYWDAVAKAQGDLRYICPAMLASNAIAQNNPPDVPAWQYQWDVTAKHDDSNGYGTKHAGTVGNVMARRDNDISRYFISFIKHLDPNPGRNTRSPKWNPLDMKDPKRLFFTNRRSEDKKMYIEMQEPDAARRERCELVRRLMPRLQQAPLGSPSASASPSS